MSNIIRLFLKLYDDAIYFSKIEKRNVISMAFNDEKGYFNFTKKHLILNKNDLEFLLYGISIFE